MFEDECASVPGQAPKCNGLFPPKPLLVPSEENKFLLSTNIKKILMGLCVVEKNLYQI